MALISLRPKPRLVHRGRALEAKPEILRPSGLHPKDFKSDLTGDFGIQAKLDGWRLFFRKDIGKPIQVLNKNGEPSSMATLELVKRFVDWADTVGVRHHILGSGWIIDAELLGVRHKHPDGKFLALHHFERRLSESFLAYPKETFSGQPKPWNLAAMNNSLINIVKSCHRHGIPEVGRLPVKYVKDWFDIIAYLAGAVRVALPPFGHFPIEGGVRKPWNGMHYFGVPNKRKMWWKHKPQPQRMESDTKAMTRWQDDQATWALNWSLDTKDNLGSTLIHGQI